MNDIIGHLKNQFARATPILFTGAGFSSSARNIRCGNLPTGGQLKDLLWNLCFPGKPYDGSSTLQDVFDVAHVRHPAELRDLLQENFTVEAGSVPEWYRTVLSLPWHRVYTLNIDDLMDAAQRRFSLPRPIVPISAMTGRLRALETATEKRLDCVHLNGTLDDAPHNVTFSVSQYAERMSRDQPWYSQLIEDIVTRPVIFIGTQLDEPPLWQYIQKRLDRGGGALEELRPKSYLVSNSLPEARQITLRQHNVVFVASAAEAFATDVLAPAASASASGLSFLAASSSPRTSDDLLEVAVLATEAAGTTSDFLFGAEPTWDDIRSARAIVRSCDRELADIALRQRAAGGLVGYILVEGTAGTGKSTLLKRLALTLAAKEPVAWVDKFTATSPRTISDGMRTPSAPRVLFIDDADVYGSQISPLLREICTESNVPLVVVGVTSARVDRVINPAILKDIPQASLVVPNLQDREIEDLLAVLERENCLGTLLPKPRADRLRVLREKCNRQLLVAMIEATSDEEFSVKIADEYLTMDPEAGKIYAVIALASAQRFDLTKHEILLSLGGIKNSTLNALETLVRRRLVYKIRAGTYVLRHHVIAEELVKQLGKQGVLGELMVDLVWAVATELDDFYTNNSPRRRLVRRLINHDFLRETIGYEEAQHYYQQLEKVLSPDFNYWLQRGSLELENGRLDAAERYISNARGINDRDLNTQAEYAYLLMMKANNEPRSPRARGMIDEAEAMLRANIAARGDRDPHAYHILVGQMILWIRVSNLPRREARSLLLSLRTTLSDGIKRHPRNQHLKVLSQHLEEEIRSIGVGG
jgi:tetratricopeptide (TPR) repeat protein